MCGFWFVYVCTLRYFGDPGTRGGCVLGSGKTCCCTCHPSQNIRSKLKLASITISHTYSLPPCHGIRSRLCTSQFSTRTRYCHVKVCVRGPTSHHVGLYRRGIVPPNRASTEDERVCTQGVRAVGDPSIPTRRGYCPWLGFVSNCMAKSTRGTAVLAIARLMSSLCMCMYMPIIPSIQIQAKLILQQGGPRVDNDDACSNTGAQAKPHGKGKKTETPNLALRPF